MINGTGKAYLFVSVEDVINNAFVKQIVSATHVVITCAPIYEGECREALLGAVYEASG